MVYLYLDCRINNFNARQSHLLPGLKLEISLYYNNVSNANSGGTIQKTGFKTGLFVALRSLEL